MARYPRNLLLLILLWTAQPAKAQRDTILNRYQRYLFSFPLPENIPEILSSYSPTSQWKDIDYTDVRRANWSLLNHLSHIEALALVWSSPRSAWYHNDTVWRVINSALDDWTTHHYVNSNWWSNEIGVPRAMRDILVLLHNDLAPARLDSVMKVFRQYRVRGTGANLTWSADLGLHDGALSGNDSLIGRCAGLIAKEIRIDTGDGVQPDFSFHQHGARLQMYQYGAAFLDNNVRIGWELAGTPWAFPADKVKLLADFVLNGWQWMARGRQSVPGTMDRSASRPNNLGNADLRHVIPLLCQLYPSRQEEFLAVGAMQEGRGAPLEGFRYFPYSDFAAYQTKQGSYFLKTISDRTLPSESINSENLKGKLLNSGDGYMIKNGKEYFNMMPVWSWDRLPGITSFDGADKIMRKPFCGSVGNGNSGASVMDYMMTGTGGLSLSAGKFWVCHNGLVVCLIGGIQEAKLTGEAYTSLDQCRRQGAVTVNRTTNSPDVLEPGMEAELTFDSIRWVYHAGLAYICLSPSMIRLHLAADTGSWRSINVSEPTGTIQEEVFNPILVHAYNSPASTGYVLALCDSAGAAEAIAASPSWKVLRNDRACQAVQFNDGLTVCAFYTPGTLALDGKNQLLVSRPCMLMLDGVAVYASDPAHKGGELLITQKGKVRRIKLPKDGTTVRL